MSTPTNELERRLAEALTARADLVGPADLTPALAPHVSPPWWARLRPAYVGGGVLVAVAAAVVAIAVIGNGSDERTIAPTDPTGVASDSPVPTQPPSQQPSQAPTQTDAPTGGPTGGPTGASVVPEGLLPKDEITWSRDGETVPYDDGSTATVTGTSIEVTVDGATSTATLPADAEGGLAPFQLQLGQAGVGYLVLQSAGEFAQYSVVVVRGGQAVVAAAPDEPRLGSEYVEGSATLLETWTAGDGSSLYTRVAREGGPDDDYDVYRWEVSGPGEGGGPSASADPEVTLVPTLLGVACFEPDGSAYAAC